MLRVHAAAPADLDHVAEPRADGRLADQADIGDLALAPPSIPAPCTVPSMRGAFLVAGDQQADRAGGWPVGGDEARSRRRRRRWRPSCRRRRGRTARRPAPAGEGIAVQPCRRPAPRRYGRQSRNAARRCRAGEEVRRISPNAQPVTGEAERAPARAPAPPARRHRPGSPTGSGSAPAPAAADRSGRSTHQSRSNSLIEVLARVCASTRLTITAQ